MCSPAGSSPSFQDIFICVPSFPNPRPVLNTRRRARTQMLQDVLDLGPARLFGLARLLLSVQVLVGMVGCLAFVYGTM